MAETPENTDYGPYTLRKRFRHDEEFSRVLQRKSWRKHILNLDEDTFLERNVISWILILIFYAIFFTCIVGFFFASYHFFMTTIDLNIPKVSMLQPGFSFQPVTAADSNRLIEYSPIVVDDIQPYVDTISDFLDKYSTDHGASFGPCNGDDDFGYPSRNPCVFLKVNAIIGFIVEPYVNAGELPNKAPQELRKFLNGLSAEERKDRLWLSCQCKTNLKFEFYPNRSIPIRAVDLASKKKLVNYHDAVKAFYTKDDFKRVVALRIPDVPYDIKHNIKCFMWAKNIEIDEFTEVGMGMIRFELRVTKGILKITN